MTIYSLYIFDRHCTCVYYQDWHRTKRPRPSAPGGILPGVSNAIASDARPDHAHSNPRNTLNPTSGVVVAAVPDAGQEERQAPSMASLTFDEEAKLVYGVLLSLRHMVKRISGREDAFVNYRTSTYKLHLYETITGYKFVMLSDPAAESLRFAMRQIYTGPFLDYVVRNPLLAMDSKEQGIDNEYFRAATDRLLRGMTVFN